MFPLQVERGNEADFIMGQDLCAGSWGGAGRVFHRYREKEKYELYEKNVKKSDLFGYGIAVDTWNDAVICNG